CSYHVALLPALDSRQPVRPRRRRLRQRRPDVAWAVAIVVRRTRIAQHRSLRRRGLGVGPDLRREARDQPARDIAGARQRLGPGLLAGDAEFQPVLLVPAELVPGLAADRFRLADRQLPDWRRSDVR